MQAILKRVISAAVHIITATLVGYCKTNYVLSIAVNSFLFGAVFLYYILVAEFQTVIYLLANKSVNIFLKWKCHATYRSRYI